MGFAYGETVTVLSPAIAQDGYGDPTADWSNPVELVVDGCGIADGGSIEPTEAARSAVVSDFDVITPPGTPVTAQDRIVVRGLTCQIVGRPFDWLNPFTGWRPGMVVRVKIAEG